MQDMRAARESCSVPENTYMRFLPDPVSSDHDFTFTRSPHSCVSSSHKQRVDFAVDHLWLEISTYGHSDR